MTTYYDGLKVPQFHAEFDIITLDALGKGTITLKYFPTEYWMCQLSASNKPGFFFNAESITGKVLSIGGFKPNYQLLTSIAATDAAGGGAVAEPHTHVLNYTLFDVNYDPAANEANCGIIVHYEVGGT